MQLEEIKDLGDPAVEQTAGEVYILLPTLSAIIEDCWQLTVGGDMREYQLSQNFIVTMCENELMLIRISNLGSILTFCGPDIRGLYQRQLDLCASGSIQLFIRNIGETVQDLMTQWKIHKCA